MNKNNCATASYIIIGKKSLNLILYKKTKYKNISSDLNNKKDKLEKNEPNHEIGNHNKAAVALKKNGIYFTKSLIEAYDNNIISDLDLSRNLKLPLEAISEIRKYNQRGGIFLNNRKIQRCFTPIRPDRKQEKK